MKTKTKIVTLPDGRTVKFSAQFGSNYDEVRAVVEGPLADLVELVRLSGGELGRFADAVSDPVVDGAGFEGWEQRLLDAAGCKVENSDDGGDWVIYRE